MKIKTNHLSKVYLLILFFSFSYLACFSQEKETFVKKFYATGGGGPSSHGGSTGVLGLQALLKNNWSASVSFHNLEMDPKNLPANYTPGSSIILVFPINDPMPSNDMTIISLMAGKCFQAGRRIWFTAEAGASVVTGNVLSYTSQPIITESSWLISHTSSNYATSSKKETTLGGMLKADFNWAFLPWVGVGTGVYANFNSIQSPIGFQVMLTAGWMNLKKKNKH